MRCKRCGEDLEPEDFRPLRKQRRGVCKACEHMDAYEWEMRSRERRRERAQQQHVNVLRIVSNW